MFDSMSSLEVLLVPEDQAGDQLADLRKAQMCPAGSLLCCLGGSGQLMLWAPGDRRAPRCSADGHFSDFSWEEVTASSRSVSSFHLLAVGSQGDLKLLEAEAEPSVPVSLLSVQKCSADRLLEAIGEKNHSVCELDSVQVLCFVDGRFRLLVNWSWLLQLQWERESGEAKMISCHHLQPISRTQHAAVQLCGETLFTLSSDGLIYVFAVTDGALLASINLPAYLEDDLSSSSSSFCLVQVSADLSTAVVVTQSHAAVAVDLNHYFRLHPDHLLCVGPQSNVPLQHKDHRDQDSLSSSSHCLAALGSALCDDRSWETRLALMCSRAQQVASPSPPSKPAERLWFYSLPHLQASSASASSQSRAPPGGAVVHFSVPETSTPSLLAVSEFSALLTFVTPGNTQTTVALWDMESGSVSYHQSEDVAVPVQHSGERQQRLLLKRSGVFQVMFSMPQQDLLSRLMLFGSAATVDAVCKLNSWGHCSIPFHALQAGLKNRQLDTVDLYLKSKENLLNSSASVCVSEQSADSKQSLKDSVQELFLALDLLCSTVRDLNSEAQSRQFSEQLLNLTLSFINTQIRSVLLLPHCENPDVLNSVKILDTYVTELRNYLKRFPWSSGSSTSNSGAAPPREDEGDEWEQLTTEEVIYQAVLTNQIPRAQAVMWRLNRPEQHLSALRMVGLNHVLSCLQSGNLQTAKTLLTNMGLSVKKELHSICLYTKDRNLRELLVEDMSSHGFLPEDEMQSVSFIRKMEKLGLLPARSCPADPLSQRVPRIAHDELEGRELLEELVEQRSPEEVGELWRNIQLHWVKNWDHDCQTAVLLSRLQHTELSLGDSSVLWRYLTSLHDKHQVAEWIHNQRSSDSLCWPDITPEVVSSNTACSIFFKENILDLLARKAVFIPEEMSDLEQLLWRLAQGGGLMGPAPPVPQYCSPVGLDLHSAFVSFCLERNLQYLLYTYLEHYRLTPRNCPLLMDQSLFGSQPWFEMLVKTQEITRNLSDTELVFQASLTSAQVLLPGSQASLSSLLLEGHSLLALASIMFAHGGIDQVMIQGQQAGSVQRTVDPQLLKMALASHSKLRAALFPSGCFGNGTSSDISVYQLLQSIHHLDVSRLFAWQVPNTLNSTETSELPHFSSSQLVGRFALVEKLDYLYYIHHGRPSFAYGNVVIQQLGVCSDVQSMLQKVWLQVYRLALKCFNVPSVTSSAVCFCELLGICSLKLRVDIRAMNTVLQHWNQLEKHTQAKNLLVLKSKAVKLVDAEPGVAEELLGYLEAAVIESLEQRGISRSSYEAAQEWALPVQFSKLHSLELSPVYPRHCAEDRQFIHFLLFVQLYNFPLQQVRSMLRLFGPILQAHLTVAFQDLQVQSRTRSQEPQEQLWVPRSEEAPGSSDLFQVVLRSQQEQIPVRFLLHEAMVQRCPVLAVLAACLKTAELLPCLCVWILTSVDNKTAEEATSHLGEAPQHHEWTLHDLSIIWETLLWRGHFRILLRGFELFQQDCPLVLVLRMFELCCDYRNFTEAKTKLMDFQRTLIALRNGGPTIIGSLPLQWVESQASVLLLTMLQRSSSQYDLHRLLQLLADVDKLLKSNGPDFRKLSKLSQLLQGSGVTLPQRLLHNTPPSIQEEEFATIVDTLQSRGCYSQARQVAELAGLPVDRLLLSQLLQEANVHKTRWQWRHLETRVAFWRKCHRLLKDDGTDPKLASQFFLSQSEGGTANSGDETQNEVVDVQERCLLLQLAAHWLSLLIPVPVDELERLEKKLWFCQVRKHLLTAIMEKDSMFKLPPAAVHPETNAYEMFMKDFTFSSIADLNTEKYLRLDGFPSPSENLDELDPESDLGSEGRRVLRGLIGQLLDQGGLHEASRVCRHFSIHSPDVWRLLRCHALAGGVLAPEPQEETPEGAETKALTHSPSLSSLSSFVMVPLPEDAVTIQIQRLLDQCRHGSSYCKQILSLYQLSKEMQCPYSQLSREEPQSVLQKLLLLEQPDRFRMAKAFIRAQGLGADAVAELVSDAVLQGLLASAQDLQPGDKQIFRPSEGNESLVQLIKLCDDPNLVGLRLLENLNTVPLRELNSIVELLIVAHSCFSLTCNMEGIVRVLQAARHLSHTYLAPGEHYSLMVRLLTGIGRYNEMTYIFDLLHQSHRFEMLLRKKVETERGQSSSLKTALLDYIKRCLPADSEKHNMVALCFSMRREIGENHEIAARTQLKMIESQDWVVTPELKSSLMKVLGLLKDAAESFSKDSCVRQASRCINQAKLITLQLHLLNRGSNLRIINLKPTELHAAFMALPRCYQVFVISEAYSYNPDWAEILYQKVVLKGDFVYLEELKGLRPLTSAIFEDIFRKLDSTPSGVSSNVKRLLSHCNDVYTRYRLAYQQNLYDVTKTLLQDNKTASYMNDRLNNKAFI